MDLQESEELVKFRSEVAAWLEDTAKAFEETGEKAAPMFKAIEMAEEMS